MSSEVNAFWLATFCSNCFCGASIAVSAATAGPCAVKGADTPAFAPCESAMPSALIIPRNKVGRCAGGLAKVPCVATGGAAFTAGESLPMSGASGSVTSRGGTVGPLFAPLIQGEAGVGVLSGMHDSVLRLHEIFYRCGFGDALVSSGLAQETSHASRCAIRQIIRANQFFERRGVAHFRFRFPAALQV